MKKNSKLTKENPIMVDSKKAKKIKVNDFGGENNEIKSFIIIIVAIVVIVGAFYGATELFKKDEVKEDENKTVEGTINYDKITVGTLLNRPYNKYYVLVYNSDDSKAVLYSTMLTKYKQKSDSKDYLKIYFCDLNNSLNGAYYNVNKDNKSNKNAKKIEELNFGDLTLLTIEKGKIIKYTEDYEQIKKILK